MLPNNFLDRKLKTIDPATLTKIYLRSIYTSVHYYNFSYLGLIVGRHRAGKSLYATTLSTILDRTFWNYLEVRVVYTAREFINALRNIRKLNVKGGAVVWDEAGIGIPAREWYELSNRLIGKMVQVFGHLNPVVFFVTQDASFVDNQPKKMLHAFIEMTRPSRDYALAWVYDITTNKKTGKIYYIHPRIWIQGTGFFNQIRIKVYRPPKEIEERYEEHSLPYKQKIEEAMAQRIKEFEEGSLHPKEMTTEEIIKDIERRLEYFKSPRSKLSNIKLDLDMIRAEYRLPLPLAKKIKRTAEIILNEKLRKGEIKL